MVTMLSYVGRRKNNTTFGFNPDVAFSYIDQRLQDVLGHFQKDFERDISADNLGPKYGSFLPMHLRNPLTQSQPKNPVNVHSSNIPKLLKKFEAKALPVIRANTSLSLASDSFCLEEKDNPSTRSSKTRIDYCETKLLKQPARDSKRIGPSPAFEGDSFILEKEIHKQYMKMKLSKRYRKGNKKCNLQGCSNITKKRKHCSASVAESNLNESTMENNGFSSARTSTKLFGEMQGKSNITKKRKECSGSAGESDLYVNPTENGGFSSSAHSSTKLFGNLRNPIRLAEDTLKEAIDLKHSTDRLKNVESEVEVSGIYLRATLKFLLAASMFEVCNIGSATLGEKTQSTEIYIDTSKMLNCFILSGQQSTPLSALDVTNVCEDGKPPGSEAKGVKPLSSRATFSGLHLLNYAEYVSSAMDAAQRSLSALKGAQWKYGLQGIAAVKTALDFHYHDMDGFVRLVRLALEEIDII